jgi:hypothetical protein
MKNPYTRYQALFQISLVLNIILLVIIGMLVIARIKGV